MGCLLQLKRMWDQCARLKCKKLPCAVFKTQMNKMFLFLCKNLSSGELQDQLECATGYWLCCMLRRFLVFFCLLKCFCEQLIFFWQNSVHAKLLSEQNVSSKLGCLIFLFFSASVILTNYSISVADKNLASVSMTHFTKHALSWAAQKNLIMTSASKAMLVW